MSKKKDDCIEEQPGWYNGQFLDEVGFCCDLICRHPMVCVGGKFSFWMKSAFAVISSAVTLWFVWAASSFLKRDASTMKTASRRRFTKCCVPF